MGFSIKKDPDVDVNIIRYKAILVAKGYSQREDSVTYAPVVRYESIRIILALVAIKDLEMAKFDVKTSFLYGDLEDEVYIEQPLGFEQKDKPGHVFKLLKSLYGLKQAPHCWNKRFVIFLMKFNFKNIYDDECVFIGIVNGIIVYLASYVDDGLLISKCLVAIKTVLGYLESEFKITKDEANEFVGLEITRDRMARTLKISQSGYRYK